MSEIENEDTLRRGNAKKATNDAASASVVERAPSRIHLPPYETIALMLQGGGAPASRSARSTRRSSRVMRRSIA
jgi:NTE family protein